MAPKKAAAKPAAKSAGAGRPASPAKPKPTAKKTTKVVQASGPQLTVVSPLLKPGSGLSADRRSLSGLSAGSRKSSRSSDSASPRVDPQDVSEPGSPRPFTPREELGPDRPWLTFAAPTQEIPEEVRATGVIRRKLQWLAWRMSPMGFQVVLAFISGAGIVFDVWSDLVLALTYAWEGGESIKYAAMTAAIVVLANLGLFILLWRGKRGAARFAVPPLRKEAQGDPKPALWTKAVPGLYEVLVLKENLKMKKNIPDHARILVQNNENAAPALLATWEAAAESLPQLVLQTVLLSQDQSENRSLTIMSLAFSYVMVAKTLLDFYLNYVVHHVGFFGEILSLQGSMLGGRIRAGEGTPRHELSTFLAVLHHVEVNPIISDLNLRAALRHIRMEKRPHPRLLHDAPRQEDLKTLSLAIGRVVRMGTGLVKLDLGDNDLEPEAIQEIAAALRSNGTGRWLRKLYMDGSPRMTIATFQDQQLQQTARAQFDVLVLTATPEEHMVKMRRPATRQRAANYVSTKRPARGAKQQGCCKRMCCCCCGGSGQSPQVSPTQSPK